MYSPVREYAMFDRVKTVNGKSAIINKIDMPIGIEGDTIIGRNSPVAVYHKAENRYDLYDPFLNKVKHSYNIRYIKPDNQNWLTLLVGNKLKWLTNRGIKDNPIRTLKALMVCGTVSRYIDDIKYAEGKIKLEKIKDHTMTGYNIEYFSYDINNAQEIDSLYFDRGKIQL